MFRESIQAAWDEALAAGAKKNELHAEFLAFLGIDPSSVRAAADSLDDLIDGENDDLAVQLRPARDILRVLEGSP